MRPIKFRAYGKNSKEFLSYIENGKTITGLTLENIQNIEDIDSWDFQQFTWLLDKNWKEIYDWDVLRYGSDLLLVAPYWTWFWLRWEMFRRWGFCTCDTTWPYMTKSEVVGNQFENPDLLPN